MSSIIFHWESPKDLDTPHARKHLFSRWGLTCKAFGVTRLLCVSKTPVKYNDSEIELTIHDTLEDALMNTQGIIVPIEQGGLLSIHEFTHPEEAVYVFGSDYDELKMQNPLSISTTGLPVHAEIAAGIVLAHRYSQWH